MLENVFDLGNNLLDCTVYLEQGCAYEYISKVEKRFKNYVR